MDAFHVLIQECMRKEANYFFLIDGLDELNGSKRDLIDLLGHLTGMENVKICVSSRPWVVFEDAYKQKPSLTVQDLTRNDIKHYVMTNFQTHPGFLELFDVNPDHCERIMNQVTTKASGVFLWVVLVIKSLLDGLTNGDSLERLQRRIDEVPDTLEGLFSKMLDGMEHGYYTTASELFQIFRAAKRRPTVICMSFAHEEDISLAIQGKIQPLQPKELRYRTLNMKRRLNTSCRGLLEVTDVSGHGFRETDVSATENLLSLKTFSPNNSNLAEFKVEYLHRTVKDWLYRPDIWAQISSATPGSFNPSACLARAHLLQLKSLDLKNLSQPEYGFWDLLIWCTEYSIEVGKTGPGLADEMLEELNRVGIALSTSTDSNNKCYVQRFWGDEGDASFHWASTVSGGAKDHGFLDFAIRCQLHPYLERKFLSTKLDPGEVSKLFNTATMSYIFAPGLGDAPSCNHVAPNPSIIELLREKSRASDPSDIPQGPFWSLLATHESLPSGLIRDPLDQTNGSPTHSFHSSSRLHRASTAALHFLQSVKKPKPQQNHPGQENEHPDIQTSPGMPGLRPPRPIRRIAEDRSSYVTADDKAVYNFKMHPDDIDG